MLKINHFRYKFESIDNVYRNGMGIREAYLRAGNDLTVAQQWEQVISDYTYNMNGTPKFEVLYKEYLQEKKRSRRAGGVTTRTIEIDSIYPLVGLAYRCLTPEKVEALRYNSTDIKNEVHFESPVTQKALKSALGERFFEGGEYTDKDAKAFYQESLNSLAIKRTAKSTELKKRYLITESKKVRSAEGGRKNGFVVRAVVSCLIALNKRKENRVNKPNIIKKAYRWMMSIFSVK